MKQIVKGDQVMCKRASSNNYNKAGVVLQINSRKFVSDRETAYVQFVNDIETVQVWQLSLMPEDDQV